MSDGYYDPSEVDLRDIQHERRIHELTSALHDTLEQEATFALEVAKLKRAFYKTSHGVEQILGKALHYPSFVADPKHFPDATVADGVCVGEHVPESIAEAAANRIKELEEQLARTEEKLAWATEALEKYRTQGDENEIPRKGVYC